MERDTHRHTCRRTEGTDRQRKKREWGGGEREKRAVTQGEKWK